MTKKEKGCLTCLALWAVIIALIIGGIYSYKRYNAPIVWIEYTVQSGDTLDKIIYQELPTKGKEVSKIRSDIKGAPIDGNIHPGDVIYLPVYRGDREWFESHTNS